MKRLLLIFIICLSSLVVPQSIGRVKAQSQSTLSPGDVALVSGSALTLYTRPDTAAAPIIGLPVATQVTITRGPTELNGLSWWRVRSNLEQGWVAVKVGGDSSLVMPTPDLIGSIITEETTVLAGDPTNSGAYFTRGLAYFAEDNYQLALNDFTQAISFEPSNAFIYHQRGLVYEEQEDYDKALVDFERAITLKADHPAFYHSRGSTYSRLEQYDEAVADFDQTLSLNASDATAYNDRAIAYWNLGDYYQAEADYSRAIELDPYHAYSLHNRGLLYAAMGDIDAALADLTAAVEADTSYATGYTSRGRLYHEMGEDDLAMADFARAIEIDPEYVLAYEYRGLSYVEMGRYEEGVNDLKMAVTLEPTAMRYYDVGYIYAQLGQHNDAIEYYSLAIDLDSYRFDAYFNRAMEYLDIDVQNYEAALDDLNYVLSYYPDWVDAYIARGDVYVSLGQTETAIKDYNAAVDLDFGNYLAHCRLGLAYYYVEDYNSAMRSYMAAIGLEYTNPDAHEGLARVYRALGRTEDAEAEEALFAEYGGQPGINVGK